MQLPPPCYLFSDAHLGVASAERERELIALLRALPGHAASLVVNGDLFDFWFEWKHVMPRRGYRVLAALADVREAGVEVLWIGGNHDCWGGEIVQSDVGVAFHLGAWDGELGGWRARVEHGDGLRAAEDRPYRALRRVLRSPLAIRAFRALHPDFGTRIASGSSHTSRRLGPGDGGAGLRSVALGTLQRESGLELVVYGHSHVRALERGPRGGVFANPGAWLDAPTYLRIDEREIAAYRWTGALAESDRLGALERLAEEAGGHA